MLDPSPFVIAMLSMAGNAIVILFVYFSNRKDKFDDSLFEKFNSKADKRDTDTIFKFIKEIRDKIENSFVKSVDCRDFKTRIGEESNSHRKEIQSLKIGVAVLLERSGEDPSIMERD